MLRFAFELLGAMGDDAGDRVARLGAHVPPDGVVHVEGGLEDEVMRPLDFAPSSPIGCVLFVDGCDRC